MFHSKRVYVCVYVIQNNNNIIDDIQVRDTQSE